MNNIQEKFYWKVGQKIFYNKHKAVVEMDRSGMGIEWHLPSKWLTYDWTKKPNRSFWEIMSARAKEIREKYRYVRLWFSGGCDSQTVLQCFMANDIHIDEIFLHSSGVKESDYEISDTAIPFLSKHKQLLTKTKINHYVTTKKDYVDWHSKKYWETEEGIYHPCVRPVGPLASTKYGFRKMPGEINIICSIKSYLTYKNNNWYTYIPDYEFDGYHLPDVLYFFCQDPEIYHSQSLTLVDFIEKQIPKSQWQVFTNSSNQEKWNQGMQRARNLKGSFLPKLNDFAVDEPPRFKSPLQQVISSNQKEHNAWLHIDNKIINDWQRNLSELYDLKRYFNKQNPWLWYVGCPGHFISLATREIVDNTVLFPGGYML